MCKRWHRWAIAALLVLLLGAEAALSDPAQARERHPLIDVIWSSIALAKVDHVELAKALRSADIGLVGEVHDNADAHRRQAEILAAITDASRRPAVVFEHIRDDQKQSLEKFETTKNDAQLPPKSGDLLSVLEWEKSGWPDRAMFEPLFSVVIAAKLPIYAGDPARETVRRVAKEGVAALPPDEIKRLGLDTPLPAADQDGLLDQLEQSHCGLMPKAAFGNLAFAQRYRDAHLADAVLKAVDGNGSAILFAGNGHARKDRGVPYYLKQRAPDKKVASVMLIEVEEGKTDPGSYVERGPDGQPTADYIVFTPKAERADPCEEMKKRFRKAK